MTVREHVPPPRVAAVTDRHVVGHDVEQDAQAVAPCGVGQRGEARFTAEFVAKT